MLTSDPRRSQQVEDVASEAGLVVGEGLRAVEILGAVFLGLLVCPPLLILVVLVVVPLLVIGLVVGLVAAVLSAPYLLVHHFRAPHRGHVSLFAHRLRAAGRALVDLLPHRIVADVRKAAHGR